MGAHCCHDHSHNQAPGPDDHRYRRVLWIALLVNASMFAIEIVAGVAAGSVALKADALDFLSDSATYAISLLVLGMALQWRARAALAKGISLGVIGLWVASTTLYNAVQGRVPDADVMGVIGFVALAANVCVAVMLYAFRSGDANMRSVWICSRNDAIGNMAVLFAALGVFGTGTGWPDVIVGGIMAILSISGASQIIRQASGELRQAAFSAPAE
jgi:Co/Zn/Cd efflux system component